MNADRPAARPPLARLLTAFAIVYVIWGSTYMAIRLSLDTLPPFTMTAVRFLVAGFLLYGFLRVRGVQAPTGRQWRSAAIIGTLLLAGGNTAVVFAEQTVPSGVVALLVAMVPLWMVLLEWLRPGGVRPTLRTFAGLAVGFVGMVLLVGPGDLGGGAVSLGGAAIVMLGGLAWAGGSIYSRQAELPKSPLMATAAEMLSAGAVLTVATLVRGELRGLQWSHVSTTSVLALAYLVVFGSLVAFSAYVWLLGNSTPALVSTYAYVNPVVAVFLGWMVLSEPITPRVLLAAAVIIGAVAIITTGRKPAAAKAPAEAAERPAVASPEAVGETAGDGAAHRRAGTSSENGGDGEDGRSAA